MSEREWCIDPRHGSPCRASCGACRDECDRRRIATTKGAMAAFPCWTPADFGEKMEQAAKEAVRR